MSATFGPDDWFIFVWTQTNCTKIFVLFFYFFKIHWCSLFQLACIHTHVLNDACTIFFIIFFSFFCAVQFFEFHFTYWAVQMLLINNFPMGRYRAIEPWLNSYPKATHREIFFLKNILWVNEMILTHSNRFGIQNCSFVFCVTE